MKNSASGPAGGDFRDRSGRLTLFGILSMLLGAACVLLGLAHLLPPLFGSDAFGDPRALLMSMLTYCIIGAILAWTGFGSLRMRRWVQPIMLVIGWCWLLLGLCCMLLVVAMADDLVILATAGMEELPRHTGVIVKAILIGLVLAGGVLLPAMFVLVYRDRNLLLTCERHDPARSWTDDCPRPVLLLSAGLAITALLLLPMAVKPLYPLFGALLTGWAGALMILATAAYTGWLALGCYRLNPAAWWGAFLFLLLFGISTALTSVRVDPLLLYRALGYSGTQVEALTAGGGFWRPLAFWSTLLLTAASLAYLLAIRKHFGTGRKGGALLLTALLLLCAGCSTVPEPVLVPLQEKIDRQPVIVIPGITGTMLRERASGRVVWGRMWNLLFPRDGGYETALPLDPASRAEQRLEAFAPILQIDLPGPGGKEIYAPFLRLVKKNGYHPGDLLKPSPDDDFFFFVYDWRRGTAEAAAELALRLEALRLARGERTLRVTLVCQSNAALIGRYFIKYGGATLEEAESGRARPPVGIGVEKLILIGTANGGALRVLHEMSRGRRYIALIGRRWLPETLFTFESLFESLPAYRDDLFFDGEGEPLDVDLFDAENWMKYGWSIYAPEPMRRLERLGGSGPFSDAAAREAHLRRMLDRAARLHRLLAADVEGIELPGYYSLQNAFSPTPERALLELRDGRWETLFAEDKRIRNDPYLRSLAVSPGDGHATIESQGRLSPREEAALTHPPIYIEGAHFDVINSPATQRRLLQFLLEDP